MVTVHKPQDWSPRRNGKHYCSPSCGGNCYYADFVIATRRASKLAKALGGKFKPDVWENLGWHYAVFLDEPPVGEHGRGLIEVHPSHYPGQATHYTVFLQADPQVVIQGNGLIVTLRKAIKKYEQHAKQAARAAQALATTQLPISIPLIK